MRRDGVRPLVKKVTAIENIASPKTQKQVRRFVGLINYYRDMWPRRAHILAPLTKLTWGGSGAVLHTVAWGSVARHAKKKEKKDKKN